MCGIFFRVSKKPFVCTKSEALARRGPDERKTVEGKTGEYHYAADFYRLAIVGTKNAMQPFGAGTRLTMCNGEIYKVGKLMSSSYTPDLSLSNSDCYAVHNLFVRDIDPIDIVSALHGEFAFVHFAEDMIYFARDLVGIKPLYFKVSTSDMAINDLQISSLLAGFQDSPNELHEVSHVPPGHLMCFNLKTGVLDCVRYTSIYNPCVRGEVMRTDSSCSHLLFALKNALDKRLNDKNCNAKKGFLLSGGLDSSLLVAMAMDFFPDKKITAFTFAFDENASDVIAARKVVEYLRSRYGHDSIDWNLVIMPLREGIDRWLEVAKAIESTDTTTIRASVPMYLLSEWISKNTDIKVLISGEGADELFNGYLYSLYAPSRLALRSDSERLVENLHLFDVLRADRATAAHGLEIRPPFLDNEVIDNAFAYTHTECPVVTTGSQTILSTKSKVRAVASNYLPDYIVSARKEAFSDAVGEGWLDSLEKHAMQFYSSAKRGNAGEFPFTRRMIDDSKDKIFGNMILVDWISGENVADQRWLPNQRWVTTSESSARALEIYVPHGEEAEMKEDELLRSPRPAKKNVVREETNWFSDDESSLLLPTKKKQVKPASKQ
jgi:asparagine synthase (glutamine-hydrolysing)